MSSATYYYTRDSSRGTESLVIAGEVVRTVPSSHPNFIRIRDYCFSQDSNGDPIDMEHVLRLSDAEQFIGSELLRVTDRISFKGGKLYWDGEPTENALASHIVRMIKNRDDNYVAFAKFMEKLAQNPSEASRDSLFEWIADRDWTITEDGDFIGYKGVDRHFKSQQAGYGIVNGVEFDGHLDNSPGNVVEVPRNKVDADRNSSCSYGLHVGTRNFATGWSGSGGKMLLLAVNPRDVVMVPRDSGGQKMRVCRYVVLGENDEELTTTTYRGEHRADDEPESDENYYDQFCEECDCLLEDGECTCEGCNDQEPPYCAEGCGDEVDSEGETCEPCQEDIDRIEEGKKSFERPTPYGICKFDGYPLDVYGDCTRYD